MNTLFYHLKEHLQLAVLALGYMLFFSVPILGQQINMQNGYFEQCEGSFLDSGGGGGSYQNNENFTLTICPDVAGDVVGINFLSFDLDPTNTAAGTNNNQDRLIVYDGNSVAANSMGTFTGNSLQGVFVSASPLNTSGCLTFRFISNDVGVGDWAGTITCETPCDRPTAAGTDDGPANRRICLGQEINFDGSASSAATGFSITEYLWDFGDGNTANTPVTSHAWDEPGEYIVELFLVDDNSCASTNQVSLQFLVETEPDWEPFPSSAVICLGQSVELNVNPTDFEVTWIGAEPVQTVVVDDVLEDIVGACFDFPLQISGFSPSQSLPDVFSLISIDIDIYHTWLFDLLITITCPSGESVILHNQMQQPNGPNVGANGTDFGLPFQNECWNYSWTPQGTQTISQVATVPGNNPLPIDDYMSLESLTGLVGCDLNGIWTLTICDLWGGDDGFLCGWGLGIDPSLIPDVTEFTPVIGANSDSSYWSGPYIVETSDDGNNIVITPTEIGIFEYTYTLLNNHGCQHDSTITIEVYPGPEADAGPDIVICDEPGQLEGSVEGVPPPPPTCNYTLEMLDTFGDGWNGFSVTIVQNGVPVGTYTFNTGSSSTATIPLNHGATIQINTNSGNWDSEVSYNLINPAGDVVFSDQGTILSGTPIQIGQNIWSGTVDCQPESPDYVFLWSPETGLSDPNIQNPTVMVEQNTTYTLTVWVNGSPECAGSDEVEVTIPPEADPGQDNEIIMCYNEATFNLLDSLGGTPADTGVWTDENNNAVAGTFNPSDYPDGGTFTYTYSVTFGPCVKTSQLIIEVLEAGNPVCCQTNAVAGNGGIACDLSFDLAAQPALGEGTWSGPAGVVFSNPNNPNTTVTVPSPGGEIALYWTDDNGLNCEESDSVIVVFMDPIVAELIVLPASCPDTCNAIALIDASGGLGELTYSWSAGQAGNNEQERVDLCEGNISVEIEDEFGCSNNFSGVVDELPQPAINGTNVNAVSCFGDCDGSIQFVAPSGVSFSIDGGQTFEANTLFSELCPGDYPLEIRNELNCPNYSFATITEPDPVSASFNMSPSPTTWNNTTIQFTSTSTPEPFSNYYWVFDTVNTLGTSTLRNPVFKFPDNEESVYPVSLCVETENGCADCVSYNLVVNATLSLFVPNSFTPNGDGINDLFKAKASTEHFSDFRMRVFNRQGELVFESGNIDEGWDGGYPGGQHYVHDQVYVYEIRIHDIIAGETLKFNGHVTPLR